MRKELRPTDEDRSCELCGRTILKGERTETYIDQGAQRRLVCELCAAQATAQGWVRESSAGEVPLQSGRAEPRRSLWSRLARPVEEPPAPAPPENGSRGDGNAIDADGGRPLKERLGAARRKEARHVHAVPTDAQVKVERALELFNDSEHTRTIAGIARSLGDPWVSALPVETSTSEVAIAVAWELSWYRYRVDLGDADHPILLLEKGEELEQLDETLREWNASADSHGRLALTVVAPQ